MTEHPKFPERPNRRRVLQGVEFSTDMGGTFKGIDDPPCQWRSDEPLSVGHLPYDGYKPTPGEKWDFERNKWEGEK